MGSGIETVPGQLDELDRRFRDFEDRVEGQLLAGSERMGRLESSVDENTELTKTVMKKLDGLVVDMAENNAMTKDLRDVKTAGRVGRKALMWIGGVATGCVGIWQGWAEIAKHWPSK